MRGDERGDLLRAGVFGGIGLGVCGALFIGAYWLTTKLAAFEEFGDYLLRLGLSWLFLTFLGFLAFSGVVASLSTFFLSEDLRLLVAAPIPRGRLFLARFTRTVGQSSWMVAMFLTPVLLGAGAARCAPFTYYAAALRLSCRSPPFRWRSAGATLLLVNVPPARRARDVLMLVSLLLAAALVLILRFIEPERLLRVESLPDIADFFANLQSPVMPPSRRSGQESLSRSSRADAICSTERPGGLPWPAQCCSAPPIGAGTLPATAGRRSPRSSCQPAAHD